jgi:3-deoxy-D-manno-octulosonate 8-phosphate phosphatase KdsC-like HAD superfamily phosphatase
LSGATTSSRTATRDLAANSTADNVKLKAATEVLDRAGVKTAEQVEIDLHVTEASPAAALAERLDKLKKAADFIADQERKRTAARELEAAPDTTVIDAEIVEDD